MLNPRNCCNSTPKIKRDATIALRQVVDPRPMICLHIEMSKISARLDVRLSSITSGIAAFSVPEHHFGRINKLTNREINELHRKHPNLHISPKRKEIMIEIDTESIQSKYNGKSQKFQTRNEITRQICSCLNSVVKKTKAVGMLVMDGVMITSIAKLLYDSHNYIAFQPKDVHKSPGYGILICIYNKGIIERNATANTEVKAIKAESKGRLPQNSLSSIQVMSTQACKESCLA